MSKKEEMQKYLKQTVNPYLETLVADLLKSRPTKQALPEYCKKWFEDVSRKQVKQNLSEEDSADDSPTPALPLPKKNKVKGRSGVSAEVYGSYNKKEDFKPRVIPKAQDVRTRILTRLKESFLFRSLEQNQTSIVIDAMEEKKYKAGDKVISQGQDGDVLYVVDSGELDCFKKFKEGEEKHLKVYMPGEAFGQLSLLYNAPRAATIIAKKDSILFALDRMTFNNIVKEAAQKRRKVYDEVLSKVQLLKQMDPYERNQIADVLKDLNVSTNQYVIKQGQTGDKFYIVVKGEFAAIKKNQKGQEKAVLNYKEGDYFGELALLKDVPRQASVVALTNGKLVYIQREAFKRVLGSVQAILQRNTDLYKKYK